MRYRSLDNAKWILTLLIVLYHIQFRGDDKYNFTFMMIKNLGDCVVPAFAIISAFLFWSTVRKYEDLKEKKYRRVYTLLIPYVSWNLINTIYINWQNGKSGVDLLELNIWSDIIMWNSSPHFWYLFMLIFWTVLSPVLYLLYKNWRGILVLFVLSGMYLIYKGDAVLHSRYIYILYVWAGLIGFWYPNFITKIVFNGKKRIVGIIVSSIIYIGLYFTYCHHSVGMGVQVWLYAIRAIALLIVLVNIPVMKIGILTNFKYSFWIFSVHYWLDSFVSIQIIKITSNSHVYQLLTWATVVTIGLTTGYFIDKKLPGVFKLLTGR